MVRGKAGRREAIEARRGKRVHEAARMMQRAVRQRLVHRQALQRRILRKWGACASCCSQQPDVFFAGTEQVLVR